MKSFVFPYDLGLDMAQVQGTLTFFADGRVTSAIGGDTCLALCANDFKEAKVKAGVGCGLLYVTLKAADGEGDAFPDASGTDKILCRFSMSGLTRAGEFCKIVNYYNRTGVADIPDALETRWCPKCGRALIDEMNVCVFCYNKMSVLKRAFSYMKPYAKKMIFSQAALFIADGLFLSVAVFTGVLIDRHLSVPVGPATEILLLAGAMLLARVVGEVSFIFSARLFNRLSVAYCNDLRVSAYEKMQKMPMASFSKRTPGDIIRRIMEDTANIRDFMTDGGRWCVEMVIMFIIVMGILLVSDWRLTLLVMVPVPLVCLFLTRFWRIIRSRFERQWRKNSKCSSILHDIIKGIRTVKAFGNEKAEIEKFAQANRELATISSDNEALWARLFPLLTFFAGIGELLVLYFGGRAVLGGTLRIGILVQFTMLIGHIYGPLRWLVSFPRWLANATTSMVKLFEIMDEGDQAAVAADMKKPELTGGVQLDDVSFGYKSYEPVLKNILLGIKPGEMVGLVGKSGVGKTTLINLVMRLYDPNMGAVKISGSDLRDIDPGYLHENIGVVFQDSFLFAGSYYDNIRYAKPDATPEEIIAAAKAANAHDFIVQTPDGYNTLIGEGGVSISGGERQRLSIARAIVKNPDVLILDEATSSLDVETELAIQESLGRLVKGRTTIAIAHRLSTLRNADRLVVLDQGGVAEMGTHSELLKKKGLYYNLVMAQRQSSKQEELSA